MSLPPRRRRLFFWRFASPSTLIFALLLFPLPWIQLQCEGPRNPPKLLTRAGIPRPLAELIMPSDNVVVMITQSGWQAARGQCARDAQWDKQLRQSKQSDKEDE